MPLEYTTLESLSKQHPAWRLLRSDYAPLTVSFLHRVLVLPNVRGMPASALSEALEDELYFLRDRLGPDAYPKNSLDYLNDWAAPEKGWLRKFYPHGSDEPHFDLTPSTEKAIAWIESLTERSFVGTESRLLTVFDLLRQMSEGSEADPGKRLLELTKRRADIDAEIAQVHAGQVPVLDDTSIRDRFLQFIQVARDLLTDFREVEHNFRALDRRVRERIALWDGSKGELLEEIIGERDAIGHSDQGRSFRAFWDFLMSSSRQEALTEHLSRVLSLPAVAGLTPDPRTARVHYDWLEAGEHAQRTVAQLSQQLRRFLDDRVWLENRRIMDILRGIEGNALALRQAPPAGDIMSVPALSADVDLPMERPLYRPVQKPVIADIERGQDEIDLDDDALYSQVVVDLARLRDNLSAVLRQRTQVTLRELVELHPLQQGLAEVVAYLQLGSSGLTTMVDESTEEVITWQAGQAIGGQVERLARLLRVIFMR
jgi:hypothetical protein